MTKELAEEYGSNYLAVGYHKLHTKLAKQSLNKSLSKPLANKIMTAQRKGAENLIQQHIKLMNTSPEYRKALGEE